MVIVFLGVFIKLIYIALRWSFWWAWFFNNNLWIEKEIDLINVQVVGSSLDVNENNGKGDLSKKTFYVVYVGDVVSLLLKAGSDVEMLNNYS